MNQRKISGFVLTMMFLFQTVLLATEVFVEPQSESVQKIHPKTGKPYLCLVSKESLPGRDPLAKISTKKYSRPDYRILDYKINSKDIAYDGPYSDRRKIYGFAATVATVGTVGGILGMTTAVSTATTAGASGGAGLYGVGGATVAAGTVGGSLIASRPDPHRDDFSHISEAHLIKSENQDESASSGTGSDTEAK